MSPLTNALSAIDTARRMHAAGLYGLAYAYTGDASQHLTAAFTDLEHGRISYRAYRATLDDLGHIAGLVSCKRRHRSTGWKIVR